MRPTRTLVSIRHVVIINSDQREGFFVAGRVHPVAPAGDAFETELAHQPRDRGALGRPRPPTLTA